MFITKPLWFMIIYYSFWQVLGIRWRALLIPSLDKSFAIEKNIKSYECINNVQLKRASTHVSQDLCVKVGSRYDDAVGVVANYREPAAAGLWEVWRIPREAGSA